MNDRIQYFTRKIILQKIEQSIFRVNFISIEINGFAKAYSGVNLDAFVKKITFQKISKKGIKNIGKAIEIMADAEGLQAHKNAVSLRLKSLN